MRAHKPEMRAYAKIIVEQLGHGDQWAAWFQGYPGLSAGGEWPSMAIERLLELTGAEKFLTDEIFAHESACTETHQEFFIPFKRLRKLPKMSVN